MADTAQISGSTLTITLDAPLAAGTAYHVLVDKGAVTDMVGNEFQGILDEASLTFTTANA